MCPRCVMDMKSDPSMVLEANGKCERCNMYDNAVASEWNHGRGHERELESIIAEIKKMAKARNMIV